MSFLWFTTSVKDMEESIEFYEKIVGIKVKRRFQAGGDLEIAFLGDGETELELKCDKNQEKIDIGQDVAIGFRVDSLSEKMDFIRSQGLKIHSGPFTPQEDLKFFFVLDPDGLKVQFVEIG